MRKLAPLITASTLGLISQIALGDTITNISLSSYYNESWSTEINGSTIVAAPTNGNTGTGLTFGDYNGQDVVVGEDFSGQDTTQTIDFSGVLLDNNSAVNTLMNLLYGVDGAEDAIVTFTASNGDTATYDLYGNDTIRDYNNNLVDNHSNGLSGSDPGVTAQMWWDNCSDPTACSSSVNYQRLDAQTFTLPASWSGYDLVSMTITDPWSGFQQNDIALSALQVDVGAPLVSAVPEPASVSLLLAALFGVTLYVRRRRLA